ncbi:chromosome assembly protein [Cryptosporidium felis]|nr:chromosome assembly protein [Cryptosporidium felis]
MISPRENLNMNRAHSDYHPKSTPICETLSEMTKKAVMVRSLLEKRNRDEILSNILSTSNDKTQLDKIKLEIISSNQDLLRKAVDSIEGKMEDLSNKNKESIILSIDKSIGTNREMIELTSSNVIEEAISKLIGNKENYIDKELLIAMLDEQKKLLKDSSGELKELISESDNKIIREVSKLMGIQKDRENSVYLSQLAIIQKQYELIIRDLRRRNLNMEQELETKISSEHRLSERIKSLDYKINEFALALNEKNSKINHLNLQLKQLREENEMILNKNTELTENNGSLVDGFEKELDITRNKYLSIGYGIGQFATKLDDLFFSRCKQAFNRFRSNSEQNNSDREVSEDRRISFELNSGQKIQKSIKINESNLIELIDVEKRIQEHERERNMVNTLLSMIHGKKYTLLDSFSNILNLKRIQVLGVTFSALKRVLNQ